MPFDGLITKKVCEEYNEKILYGKVDKIIQPSKDDVLLFIRNNRITYKVLFSINAQNARTHLTTDSSMINPSKPFNFCMVLRKYLLGAKLTDISQIGNDRILNFTFENSNELGDKETKILIIEIMGKYSNLILTTQKGIIIDVGFKADIQDFVNEIEKQFKNIDFSDSIGLSDSFDKQVKDVRKNFKFKNSSYQNLYDFVVKCESEGKTYTISSLFDYFDVDNNPDIKEIIDFNFAEYGDTAEIYYNECTKKGDLPTLDQQKKELLKLYSQARENSQKIEILRDIQQIDKKINNIKDKNNNV